MLGESAKIPPAMAWMAARIVILRTPFFERNFALFFNPLPFRRIFYFI
jgi:hypothetical protein